ncbi:hypothetical protein FRC11_003201 [Ceratobasidium sp. 423]|nr:hypothetical protein FRC11_003201 [Ceratobasidium sp. 423]
MPAASRPTSLRRSGPLSKMDRARLVVRRPPVRQHLNYEQKIEVIDFYHRFKNQLTLEGMVPFLREMGYSTICATTIRRFVDNEARIRQYVAENPNRLRAEQESIVTHPQVEHALIRWVNHKLNINFRLQGDLLVERRMSLATCCGYLWRAALVSLRAGYEAANAATVNTG